MEGPIAETARFIDKVNDVLIIPIIGLLMAVAFLMFLIGCAEYVINAADPGAREQGVKHITWGIIGLVVMVSAWGILELATATFGLNDELNCANNPSGSGCAEKFSIPPPKPAPAPAS